MEGLSHRNPGRHRQLNHSRVAGHNHRNFLAVFGGASNQLHVDDAAQDGRLFRRHQRNQLLLGPLELGEDVGDVVLGLK